MGDIFCMHNGLNCVALDANGGDVILHPVFSPNTTMKKSRSYLAGLNTLHIAEEENCTGKVTTENEQHPQALGALKLDIGVTGIGNSEQ